MEAEAAVGEGVRLFCPNPQCSQLLVADDKRADTPMDCPHCTQLLCANCGVTWHQGMTCQAYQVLGGGQAGLK
jgi:E3 ubiquitin-protein ligase RNF144